MYLVLIVVVYILFAIRFVDWKQWMDYYPTIQYFIVFNLLYNFLYYNHTLWAYKAVSVNWLNHTIIEVTFTFFILPVIIMVYLKYFPTGKKKFLYVGVWISFFSFLEYIFFKKGLFIYDNGWGLGWSIVFNAIIFTLLRLHYKRPLLALGLSIPIISLLMIIFHPSFAELK